jgi:hypothetical protein
MRLFSKSNNGAKVQPCIRVGWNAWTNEMSDRVERGYSTLALRIGERGKGLPQNQLQRAIEFINDNRVFPKINYSVLSSSLTTIWIKS